MDHLSRIQKGNICIHNFLAIYLRLNEGFTVFLERKVLGRLYGEDIRHFEAEMGWNVGLIYKLSCLLFFYYYFF